MLELLPPPPEDPPELPPLGMLLLDPPELPEEPEEPDEPDEPPDDGLGILGEGMLEEEDCCCPAQPPMRNAEIAPMSVVFAAMTRSRLQVGLVRIAWSPVRHPRAGRLSTQLWSAAPAYGGGKRNLRLRS